MAGTLVKSVKLRITADDGDTEAKLDDISRKADDLAAKHPDLKVKIDTAAAAAKLAVLRAELKRTDAAAADTGGQSASLKDRLLGLGQAATASGGRLSALRDGVNNLTLGLSGGVGQMTMFQKVMWGMNLATGLGEPLVAGLTVATLGFASSIAAGGAGLGIFGLVAKSTFSGLTTQITAASAAEEKMANARSVKQMTADTKAFNAALSGLSVPDRQIVTASANAESGWHSFVQSAAGGVASVLVPALGLVPKALADMRPVLAPVEASLRGLVGDLGTSLSSGGLKTFFSWVAANAGPAITGLAHAVANIAVGFGGLLRAFTPVSHGIMGGLDALTAKFAHWGSTLTGHSGFQSLMGMFRVQTPMAVNALKALAGIAAQIVKSMTGLDTFSNSKMLFQLATPILQFVNALLKAHPELVWLTLYLKLAYDGGKKLQTAFAGVSAGLKVFKDGRSAVQDFSSGLSNSSAAASDATGAWGTFGGKISGLGGMFQTVAAKMGLMRAATVEGTVAQEGMDVAMEANPVGIIITAIGLLVAAIVVMTIKFKFMRDFWKAAWHDIKTAALDVFHVLEPALKVWVTIWKVQFDVVKTVAVAAFHLLEDAVKLWVRMWVVQWDMAKTVVMEAWRLITGWVRINVDVVKAVLSWFGRLGSLFRGWWDDAANAVMSVTTRLIGFVRTIPGKILSALSSLGSMLFNAGVHAMESLIGGITSKIGSLGSLMGNVASKIAGFVGLSPAKEGPLSGGGAPRIRGMHIVQDMAAGIAAGTPAVAAAMARAAAAAGAGRGGAVAGPGAGGPAVVLAPMTGGSQLEEILWEFFRHRVREKGGGGPFSAQKALGQVWPAGA